MPGHALDGRALKLRRRAQRGIHVLDEGGDVGEPLAAVLHRRAMPPHVQRQQTLLDGALGRRARLEAERITGIRRLAPEPAEHCVQRLGEVHLTAVWERVDLEGNVDSPVGDVADGAFHLDETQNLIIERSVAVEDGEAPHERRDAVLGIGVDVAVVARLNPRPHAVRVVAESTRPVVRMRPHAFPLSGG